MKNPFEHIVRAYQGRHDSELLRPFADFYWRSLVTLAMLASIICIGYGTWQYFEAEKILGESTPVEASDSAESAYNAKALKETLESLAKRQSQYELNKVTPPVLVDPSK